MSVVYLIPSTLQEEGQGAIPPYILDAIKNCQVFFAENERTTRRYFKLLWKEMVIDQFEWVNMNDNNKKDDQKDITDIFKQNLRENKNIGLISEAGCPGIADPGQVLVEIAHQMNAEVRPLAGPNSIILALMASGMNGQHFQFAGYLPVDNLQRIKAIKELETESAKKNLTQIFIETPYRNNQMMEAILKTCNPSTKLCVAAELTGKNEWIKTRRISDWQKNKPELHKKPAIFLIYAEK